MSPATEPMIPSSARGDTPMSAPVSGVCNNEPWEKREMIQVEVERWVAEGMLEPFRQAVLELRGSAARQEGFWGG